MSFQKLLFVVCLLALLTASNQRLYKNDSDSDVTITHPSVFHEEYLDTKSTIQGVDNESRKTKLPKALDLQNQKSDSDSEVTITHPSVFHEEYLDTKSTIQGVDNELRKSKLPKSLDLEDQNRSIFQGLSDTSSSDTSESSDVTDASETSDSDVRGDVFDNISGKAKEFEGKAYRKISEQRKLAKLQARKYWEALRFKILREANATGISQTELSQQLRNGEREAKQLWRDLKWKIRNGNDILDELLENTDQLNSGNSAGRGSTQIIENDTAI